jgi:hypothetical protein
MKIGQALALPDPDKCVLFEVRIIGTTQTISQEPAELTLPSINSSL